MNILICSATSLLILLVGYVYLNYSAQKETKEGNENKSAAGLKKLIIPDSKKKPVYYCLAFASIIPLIAVFNYYMENIALLSQIKSVCLISILVSVALIDYQKHIIPNLILIVGLGLRVVLFVFEFIFMRHEFVDILKMSFIGALVLGLFFTVCSLVLKNSIGMGDVKLFILMGLFQGISAAFASVFMSLIVCFVFSIFLLATRKKSRKDSLAFAPCILVGTYLSMALIGA